MEIILEEYHLDSDESVMASEIHQIETVVREVTEIEKTTTDYYRTQASFADEAFEMSPFGFQNRLKGTTHKYDEMSIKNNDLNHLNKSINNARHFEENTTSHMNEFGTSETTFVLNQNNKRQSYLQMEIFEEFNLNRPIYGNTIDQNTITGKDSGCLRLLFKILAFISLLLACLLIIFALFFMVSCTITPNIPYSLAIDGVLIILLFIIIILKVTIFPGNIYLCLIHLILTAILILCASLTSYWFYSFYEILKIEPIRCPTLYCSDRVVIGIIASIIFIWSELVLSIWIFFARHKKSFVNDSPGFN